MIRDTDIERAAASLSSIASTTATLRVAARQNLRKFGIEPEIVSMLGLDVDVDEDLLRAEQESAEWDRLRRLRGPS